MGILTWFRIDDQLHNHPKVLSIPKRERKGAMLLWLMAGSWCGQHLTDGRIPGYMVDQLDGNLGEVDQLVRAGRGMFPYGLWVPDLNGGWIFHDWLVYNPSRATVLAKRARNAAAQQKVRAKINKPRGVIDDVSDDINGDISDVIDDKTMSHSAPTRPVPTRPLNGVSHSHNETFLNARGGDSKWD